MFRQILSFFKFHSNYILFIILMFSIILDAQNVSIKSENNFNSVYAEKILTKTLSEFGYKINRLNPDFNIIIKKDSINISPEAYSILPDGKNISIVGGDERGIIYGAFSLIDELKKGVQIEQVNRQSDSTRFHFRAIKFDLPWDTYRHSIALDQHQATCSKVEYWETFLDMMTENRFNVLTLWNLHPYTFMIKPKNYPEASPWTDEEMKNWKHLFHEIFRMAEERGIDTYLIPFNIFVTPEFAKAHNVEMFNLNHHHFVQADTSEIIKEYTRECVTQVLQEYPDLSGMGLTLGEGMGGMTPQERENWMEETIIKGMRLAHRKSKLIHRIPFSGNTGSLGATTIEMEKITRSEIEKEADLEFIEKPVWASMKFNWSHPLSTTKLIKVHGGKLFGTYFNPEPDKYKIIWTARNEDIFCLRWGNYEFIRDHIKENGHSYVGGYFIGSETYIPAKDYFTNPDIKVNWKYAFERQWLYYKLWGRLLYDADTPKEVFEQEIINRYGEKNKVLLKAFSLSGITPLRIAASFDCTWDFTLYSEGFMALNPDKHRVEYISIERQINQPPLDTSFVSIKDFVKAQKSGKQFSTNKITPLMISEELKKDCGKALSIVGTIDISNDNNLMYEVSDVKIWSNLGLFFAEKLQAAVDFYSYRLYGSPQAKLKSIAHLKKALGYWDNIIEISEPIYNEMPLVHYSEQDGKSWKENNKLRFHWKFLRKDVLNDIKIAER